jgi:NAD(P)-dependent dehydrogenase (short-subunit alcohol dehydrogenase family)
MDVSDRVAVITGASRGLGAGMARHFRAKGMRLALCARTAIDSEGDDVLTAALDVTDAGRVDRFAAAAFERFGRVDLWINNAGVLAPIGSVHTLDEEAFRLAVEVNVLGVFLGSRAYLRELRARRQPGVLVNISSGAAHSAYAGWGAYCASKAAVDMLTTVIAQEEADTGLVRAHAVAPGVIDTDMQALIRACTPDEFPAVGKFVAMKEYDAFSSVAFVADHMLALAFGGGPTDQIVVRFPPEKP